MIFFKKNNNSQEQLNLFLLFANRYHLFVFHTLKLKKNTEGIGELR